MTQNFCNILKINIILNLVIFAEWRQRCHKATLAICPELPCVCVRYVHQCLLSCVSRHRCQLQGADPGGLLSRWAVSQAGRVRSRTVKTKDAPEEVQGEERQRAGNGQKWCVCVRQPIWARSQNESEENKNRENVEKRSLDPEPVGRFHGNLPTSSSLKERKKKWNKRTRVGRHKNSKIRRLYFWMRWEEVCLMVGLGKIQKLENSK